MKQPVSFDPLGMRIHEFNKLFKETINHEAAKYGINFSYIYIMKLLSQYQDGLNQRSICNMVHLKAPTISITLQNMEQDGFLIRKKDPNDSRNFIVQLSSYGNKKNQEIKQIFQDVENELLHTLTDEEYDLFSTVLDKMKQKLMQIKEGKEAND